MAQACDDRTVALCQAGFASLALLGGVMISLPTLGGAQDLHSASLGRVSQERTQYPTIGDQKVLVTIRTIEAQGRIQDTETERTVPIRIDGRLEDLADKLKKLPFRGFVFLSADQRLVPVRKKELVQLVNGQTLAVRPLYSDSHGNERKIGLWLRWQDRSGAEILDTRMHFDGGQSMIAGTDQARDPSNGLILAVQVAPSAPSSDAPSSTQE